MQIKYRHELIKLLPSNPVTCEVGVAEGNFSRDICRDWKPSKHYLVDNWGTIGSAGDGSFEQAWHDANYKSAKLNMKPFKNIAVFLKGPSDRMAEAVADESLDLLYLDANHSYEGVKKDLQAWYPKVKKGGIIAGHDFLMPEYGVEQAVREFVKEIGVDVYTIQENKAEDAGFWFRKKLK